MAATAPKPAKFTRPPPFNPDLVEMYLGKHILVGLTEFDHLGNVTESKRVHGLIAEITPVGIKIDLLGVYAGRVLRIAPALDRIRVAKPTTYQLAGSLEIVKNPDLLVMLEQHKPAPPNLSLRPPDSAS